jgi:hypothetical protein
MTSTAMQRPTQIFLVCSPYARVGKSMTARLLGDYCVSRGHDALLFDTNPHEPVLPRFFGERCTVADLGTARGQVALIDRILVPDGIPKVVDLWHVSYRPFFALAEELEFFAEAHRAGVTPVFLLHSDETSTIAETCMQIARQWPKRGVVAVQNEGAVSLGQAAVDAFALLPPHRRLVVPRCDPVLKRILSRAGLSLAEVLRDPTADISIVEQFSLRPWLERIFKQFQNLEFRLALESAEFLG